MSTILGKSPSWIQLRNWEYYPVYIVYFPILFIWLYYSLKTWDLFFFARVNPTIHSGGMAGESKYSILTLFPEEFIPKTIVIETGERSPEDIFHAMTEAGLDFPIITKPDIGNRGFLVERIEDKDELLVYSHRVKARFLIQEYIDLPVELGVFYVKYPGEKNGRITSLTQKTFLSVEGDGKSNVGQLMQLDDRSILQIERIEASNPEMLNQVPELGQLYMIEPIGNHNRGTRFENGSALIDQALENYFNEICENVDQIHYGRFDIRCKGIEDLKRKGKFIILEFNGVNSEVTHVYDPNYPMLKAYQDIFRHWKMMYEISVMQKAKGIPSMRLSEAIKTLRAYLKHKRTEGKR